MAERNLDFDRIINRKNTRCLKYDFAVKRGKPADVLPLWDTSLPLTSDQLFPNGSSEDLTFGADVPEEYRVGDQRWNK